MIALEETTEGAGGNLAAAQAGHGATDAVCRIEQSVAYMAQHLDRPLQVATLAAQANISPSHFFALFKRRIGSAPMDYFTRLRMRRACRLLHETNLSVKEVASKLGYDDPFYFSRVFKSVNQMAPSDYRMAQRERSGTTKEFGETSNFPCQPKASTDSRQIQYA